MSSAATDTDALATELPSRSILRILWGQIYFRQGTRPETQWGGDEIQLGGWLAANRAAPQTSKNKSVPFYQSLSPRERPDHACQYVQNDCREQQLQRKWRDDDECPEQTEEKHCPAAHGV